MILNSTNNIEKFTTNKSQPYLFSYWEKKTPDAKIPEYILLCLESMVRNGKLFKVVVLNQQTIKDYLPDLRTDIQSLPMALKTDYLRIRLLEKFGGVWADADTIILQDLHQIVKLLSDGVDFIGFGCTGDKCKETDGYGKPSNWVMGSQKQGTLISMCRKELDDVLDTHFKNPNSKQFDYFDLGKLIIWKQLEKLLKTGYSYYHFPSEVDGTRDKSGLWIAPNIIFEKDFDINIDSLLLMGLANQYYCGSDPTYNWFCKLSESEIMNSKLFIAKVFKKAFGFDA